VSQSANSRGSSAAAISQRTVGVSFDLPPLKLDKSTCALLDAQPVFDHIEDALPRLALPVRNASFNWLSNEPTSSNDTNWYPALENTPQYLQCRRALNDLQVTLDQGPLGSCVDFERNRLVLVGVAACIGNMSCFIVPPRTLNLKSKAHDAGVPMEKGPDLRPQQTSGSLLSWKLARRTDQVQAARGADGILAAFTKTTSRQAMQLGPALSQMPGYSRRPLILTPSIDSIPTQPEFLGKQKPPARTSLPGFKGDLQLKVTNDFQVAAQVSGNPVKGAAFLSVKPTLTPSAGLFSSFELPMFLNFSNIGQHTKTSADIGLSVKLSNLKAGRLYLSDPTVGASLQIDPTLEYSFSLGTMFDVH
jgi:hypothetical protein